jgi:hypothetical protein
VFTCWSSGDRAHGWKGGTGGRVLGSGDCASHWNSLGMGGSFDGQEWLRFSIPWRQGAGSALLLRPGEAFGFQGLG